MKSLVTLTLSILMTFAAFAQKDSANSARKKLIIKWSPTSLIGYSAVQFAAEYFFSKQYALQLEYGLIMPMGGSGAENNKGHRIRLQPRYYMGVGGGKGKFFGGIDLHFTTVQYNRVESFAQNFKYDTDIKYWYPTDDSLYKIQVNKNIISGNLVSGYQIILRKRFSFEGYVGIGVRQVITSFSSTPENKVHVPHGNHTIPVQATKEGTTRKLNLLLGIKIGYVLF